MNSKTKFTLTITAMVMVTLIAVVSIIAVFAARTQKFSSSIKVSYTSHEVVGTASAKWLLGGVEDAEWQDMTSGDKTTTTLDFSKQLDDPTLSPGQEIPLTEPEQYAIFEYNFTNDAPRPYTLNLKYTDDEIKDENVKVTTWVTPLIDIFNTMGFDDSFGSDLNYDEAQISETFTNTIDTTILPNSKLRIYILVQIDNIGADASFSGNFTFNLDGTAITTYDETFTYYTNGENATITGVAKGTPFDIGAMMEMEGLYINMLDGPSLTVPEQYNDLDIKTIGAYAFAFQMNLTSITSFGKVENLNYGAFGGAALSGSLIIPGTVKNIIDAFPSCSGITSLTIENGVENIGNTAFYDCTGLSGILTIPESVTTIGDRAFSGCTGLSGTLIIPESVTTIGITAFVECGFESVKIGAGVMTIGIQAFHKCENLKEVTIDSQEVCNNILRWEAVWEIQTSLLEYAVTVKAKYEVVGLEDEGWTKQAEKEGEYFVYTKNS